MHPLPNPTAASAAATLSGGAVVSALGAASAVPDDERLLRDETGTLAMHPKDGWRLADPKPLGPYRRRAIAGVVAALLPAPADAGSTTSAGGAPTGPALVASIERAIRTTLTYMAPHAAFGLVALFVALDLAPIWRLRAASRLCALAPADAAALIEALSHSRVRALRMMVTAARAAALTCYYDLPEVHAHLDYDPVGHMRERIALRKRLLAGGSASVDDAPEPHTLAGVPPLEAQLAASGAGATTTPEATP